jgi:signal transduction histidine kinase
MENEDQQRVIAGLQARIGDLTRRLEETEGELERCRRAERELDVARVRAEAADRTKDEFLAVLSHELRAPLQAIANWIYLLKDDRLADGDRKHALDTIEHNVRHQTRLVEDLLDLSHIVAGQVRIERRPVDPAVVVERACREMGPAIAGKGLELDLHLDPEAAPVAGDPDRLGQVVGNLLSNACKFTPEGGRIEVRLEGPHGDGGDGGDGDGTRAVRIAVRDNGEGFHPETLPRIFERFHQANGSRTRAHGGLGLGLTIARHLVELHDGELTAASPGPGEGATFTVSLPVAGNGG